MGAEGPWWGGRGVANGVARGPWLLAGVARGPGSESRAPGPSAPVGPATPRIRSVPQAALALPAGPAGAAVEVLESARDVFLTCLLGLPVCRG